MANPSDTIKAAVDTCLLLDMFLDEDPQYSARTEFVFTDPQYHVHLPTLVGVETIATKSMRGGQQIAPISNQHIDATQAFFILLQLCGSN